jgi:hypothetical protein
MHRFESLAVFMAIGMAAVLVVALVMQLAGCWPAY